MKNVLLLGDSIRMLYQPLVSDALKDRASVYGPAENGRWSGYTLNSLRFWLKNDSPWGGGELEIPDIVHWNNGIWDLGDDYGLGRPFTSPDEYKSALTRTIIVLRKLCGESVKIILATTTPTAGTDITKPHEYNELMKTIARDNGIFVNDLYEVIAPDLKQNISPDGVHLSETGTKLAAEAVIKAIERHL